MNFIKKIYPKRVLSVLDFGADTTVVLMAQKNEDGSFSVLGAGDAASNGVKHGLVTHLGDAVESVVEAVREAERAAGVNIQTLYFNLDDPEIQSLRVRGSKQLSGEGEIRRSDVEQACQTARRLVGHFERTIVYFKELGFIIDDRDFVANPIGVFGVKLDVVAHVLQARSRICEDWARLMERAGVERPVRVFSAWSTAYGILPKEDRARKRLVIDAGRDLTAVFLFENNKITDYRVFASEETGDLDGRIAKTAVGMFQNEVRPEQVFLAGDRAVSETLERSLGSELGMAVLRSKPLGVEKLSDPKYASLVGLLHVADELESDSPSVRADRNLLARVRNRVVSYINEYF